MRGRLSGQRYGVLSDAEGLGSRPQRSFHVLSKESQHSDTDDLLLDPLDTLS